MPTPRPCVTCGKYPKAKGLHRCAWCWMAAQPAEEQVRQARHRRTVMESRPGYAYRARVPEREWPAGQRWCSGCQMFVPLHYTRGSQCLGHASEAAHASHLKRTYKGFTREDFDALYAWQDGRCYVCRQRQQKTRLAVDHDHFTDEVRGLLCSSDQWGCNHRLVGALEGKAGQDADILEIARRLVAYLEKTPLQRMRDGERDAPVRQRAPRTSATPSSRPDPGPPPF